MCRNNKVFSNKIIVFILAFAFVISPIHVHAKSNTSLYSQLKHTNNEELLFFTDKRLNLSGLTLLSLLADLGLREQSTLTEHEKVNIDNTDRELTLEIYQISSQSNGNQLNLDTNTPADFKAALVNNTLPEYIDAAMPQFNAAIRLRDKISQFKIKQAMPWPKLTSTFNPRLGQGDKEVINLKYKLVNLGDLSTRKSSRYRDHIFDTETIKAMKRFQQRHGLKQTGKMNADTLEALNMRIDQRIEKLQKNLWRWLSLPRIPPSKYIMVNIPNYKLQLVEKGSTKLDMRVIVGKATNQTPVMITSVSSITLNPTWTPTQNIINNELLPQHSQNSSILKSRNFYLAQGYGSNTQYKQIPHNLKDMLSSYRLVQMPGANNALGKARLNIINNNSIFLHDTPNKGLFKQHNRALSHGCVRIENINKLLNNLLAQKQIKSAKNNKYQTIPQHITLQAPLPVYITYQTAWIDSAGNLNWRDDLYDKDD